MKDFRNSQSLITGASSGIGLAVAKNLIQRGSKVHSFDIQDPTESIDGLMTHSVDVRKADDVTRGLGEISGELDLLFNNAGILVRGGWGDAPVERTQQMFDVNFHGSIEMLIAVLEKEKLAPNATILQMCSTVGLNPAPQLPVYSETKRSVHDGIIRLLRAVRPDLHLQGIYPGAVKTPMTMAGFSSEQAYDEQALRIWGVVSRPDQIAGKIMELLDSEVKDLIWNPDTKEYVLK